MNDGIYSIVRKPEKLLWLPPSLDYSQAASVISSVIFSLDACVQGSGVASMEFPWQWG